MIRPWAHKRTAALAALAAGLALAAFAAVSRPFALQADLTTGVGIAGTVVFGLLGGSVWLRSAGAGSESGSSSRRRLPGSGGDSGVAPPGQTRFSYVLWVTLSAAAVGLELLELFSTPRHSHPTLSSMLDSIARHQALRGLLFVAWLGVGAWLCRVRNPGAGRAGRADDPLL